MDFGNVQRYIPQRPKAASKQDLYADGPDKRNRSGYRDNGL